MPITLSDKAVKHLERMKEDKGNAELLLRVGVRSGGCSGLSYAMEFEAPDKVGKDDSGARDATVGLCVVVVCCVPMAPAHIPAAPALHTAV